MKQSIILGIVIMIAAVVLAGCTRKTISQKAGEKMVEKAIEAQTGAKVDINSNGGDVTIKTDDGQTQYSTGGGVKLPENFPQELIVADDAKLIISSSSDRGGSITYLTNDDQTAVSEKFLNDLPGNGWKKGMEADAGQGKIINFSRGNEAAIITIGDNNSKDRSAKTMVNVTFTKEANE